MRYVSVCSGIEAATVAWEPLGFEPIIFSEIEPFPSKVLEYRWPHVTNVGDFTRIMGVMLKGVADILVGGTPCQAFSVAGKRESLEDDRGNISLEFCKLAHDMGVPTVLWENVPGVLSTDDNAFGCFIAELCGNTEPALPSAPLTEKEINYNAKTPTVRGPKKQHWRWSKSTEEFTPKWATTGYAVGPDRRLAWRILDAQFFGVAQRRRRVFVVASTAEGADPVKVLFELDSVRRDTPPSRETGQGATAGTARSVALRGREGGATAELGGGDKAYMLSGYVQPIANCLRAKSCDPHRADSGTYVVHGTQDPITTQELALPLGRNNGAENAVCAFAENSRAELRTMDVVGALSTGGGKPGQGYPAILSEGVTLHGSDGTTSTASFTEICGALRTKPPGSIENSSTTAALSDGIVRRLTPIECERLQGFPDGHTNIPGAKDGPRYKAIGNSQAVPVMRWLGERIRANT
jgi:DNA (cytosine-5)-methyltransferase 1